MVKLNPIRYAKHLQLLTLIFGIGISLYFFRAVEEADTARAKNIFETRARERISAIQDTLHFNVEPVWHLASFFHSSDQVDRREFASFTGPILSRIQSIQALSWVPKIKQEELHSYVSLAEADGLPSFFIRERNANFEIVPAAKRDVYFPNYYMEPLDENREALGFDLYSNEKRKAALEQATKQGTLVLTEKIRLVQTGSKSTGFIAIVPIFKDKKIPATLDERENNLLGYVAGTFKTDEIISSALRGFQHGGQRDIIVELLDLGNSGDALYCSMEKSKLQDYRPVVEAAETFVIGGRKWKIHCSADGSYLQANKTGESWIVLALGLTLAVIVLFGMRSAFHRFEKAQEQFETFFQSSSEFLCIANTKGLFLRINPAFNNELGYPDGEIEYKPFMDYVHDEDKNATLDALDQLRTGRDITRFENRYRRKNGTYVWLSWMCPAPRPGSSLLYAVASDITEERAKRLKLERQALTDSLTGLPNRAALNLHLSRLMKDSAFDGVCAIVFLDLDGFKKVNDDLGHEAGDELLNAVAGRMKNCLRNTDFIARLGGDEFLAVVESAKGDEEIRDLAQRLIKSIGMPYRLKAGQGKVTASIGILCHKGPIADPEELIKRADEAMYKAKQSGKNQFVFA